MSRGVLGASRDSRYSGTRKGVGGVRALGLLRGVGAVWGCQEGIRGCKGCQGCTGELAGTLSTQGLEKV